MIVDVGLPDLVGKFGEGVTHTHTPPAKLRWRGGGGGGGGGGVTPPPPRSFDHVDRVGSLI